MTLFPAQLDLVTYSNQSSQNEPTPQLSLRITYTKEQLLRIGEVFLRHLATLEPRHCAYHSLPKNPIQLPRRHED